MSSTIHLLKSDGCVARRAGVRLVLVCFAATGVLVPFTGIDFGARGFAQDLSKFNQFVQTSNSPSLKMLREGRDLIDAGQWVKASEKFDAFLAGYPKDKDVDVALYWLAYAQKRQGQVRQAAKTLKRLVKFYPRSNWADEARALSIEIAGATGEDPQAITDTLDDNKEEEEIKIVALQSLFESNPERALIYAADILKPGSTAGRHLKEAAVSLLASRGGPQAQAMLLDIARTQPDRHLRIVAIRRLGDESGDAVFDELMKLYEAERDVEIKQMILRVFADSVRSPRAQAKLLEIARGETESVELRKTAIRAIGEREGAPTDALLQIYEAEQNREIKEQIIRSLSEMKDPRARAKLLEIARAGGDQRLREFAIRRLAGGSPSESVIDELMKLYEAEPNTQIKEQLLRAFGDMGENPRARAKLAEAARGGGNVELRQRAIRILGDDHDDPQIVEMLIGFYDAEPNLEVKRSLLRAFGDSKQKSGLRKLMNVARRDSSVELRKQAIKLIGDSDDPEALKFLEEILKP